MTLSNEGPSFWDTCYNNYCVDFRIGLEDGPDWAPEPYNSPNQFTGYFWDYNVSVIAWGIKYPNKYLFDGGYYGESGWNLASSLGPRWSGFDLMLQTEYPDMFSTTGSYFENAVWQGTWRDNDPAPFDKILFGWRGVDANGQTFDCIQQYHDDRDCSVTTTPEPSISIMMVIGLVFLSIALRLRRRH